MNRGSARGRAAPPGWELPLTYSLPMFFAGTLPDEVDPRSPEIVAAWVAAEERWNALL